MGTWEHGREKTKENECNIYLQLHGSKGGLSDIAKSHTVFWFCLATDIRRHSIQ